ncbi:MAG TPA: GNAT family N-acetyltransferase [Armatimonadota bacterium]|nr:GNAT family N-acetyltransferase [Armatimonadota bacterium]
MRSNDEIKIDRRRSDGSAKVYVEAGGKDVSHLYYGPAKVQIGERAAVTMAGIGGVGTDEKHRRRGLARSVFSRAVAEMKREGYTVAGLYTNKRLVAHRLYRRFGLIDVGPGRIAFKVLDPRAFARRGLSILAQQSPDFGSRRLTLRLRFDASRPIYLKIEGNDVTVLPRAARRVDLSLAMSCMTFLGLFSRRIGLPYALDAKLVQWSGDAGAFHMFANAMAARLRPVDED